MTSVSQHDPNASPGGFCLGIIGAMETEVELIIDELSDPRMVQVGPVDIVRGTLHGKDVAVTRSGIGKVNAAAATLALVSTGVSCIVNTGAAGAVSPQLSVEDFVVAIDCVHHDVDACNFGYELGQVPRMPLAYGADPAISAQMADAIATATGRPVHRGRIASGDCFVREVERRQWIAQTFDALCCDMESAAVAQVSASSQVPFVVVRAISDLADGSSPETYQEFEDQAAHASARALMAFVAQTAPDGAEDRPTREE